MIAGAGAAGIALANRLSRALEGASITIVDARERHLYQPGLTLVANGYWSPERVIDRNERFLPATVRWVKAAVAEFDPDANRIVTDRGEAIPYDFLCVATGLKVDYGSIQGMAPERIGRDGIGCVYDTPEHATRTWEAIRVAVEKGGRLIFTRPPGGIKCAGAPLKMTMLVEDRMRREGSRDRASFHYAVAGKALFSQPNINEFLKKHFPERGIEVHWEHRLIAIDPVQKVARFATPSGEVEMAYDFLHVVPKMRAPDALANSPLAWQSGEFADDGRWLEVDRHTLRHPRYPNVFGAGDCVGTPIGKTAATVKAHVPVVVENLLAAIADREQPARFGGYTSCPLLVGRGRAILVEFDYELKMVPSFSFISPYEIHWVPWVMKERLLHGAYDAMLRGRA
ncbi:MAG: FAD-dependent oxidoreductase [Xanthomonadales bacterium]|nr:FAD-dependent oxidoreductase [Xanthomonadales bacterium]